MSGNKEKDGVGKENKTAENILDDSRAELAFLGAMLGGYKWKQLPLNEKEAWGANLIIEGIIEDLTILKKKL